MLATWFSTIFVLWDFDILASTIATFTMVIKLKMDSYTLMMFWKLFVWMM